MKTKPTKPSKNKVLIKDLNENFLRLGSFPVYANFSLKMILQPNSSEAVLKIIRPKSVMTCRFALGHHFYKTIYSPSPVDLRV